ncbi:MAG: phosphohistidine phosphatase SixA [Phycisphaerae bacterium]|nr:phosphohistidine phosphatase SixA [Phycisphaerae bacterium]NIS54048.1 phosphohistidine phosphatase SixA [Phycisphaerae bacterium]NIU11271.1 phosphohistidine phosphatase SixA [Phycisphaerae bacterium]NIU59096.1 phosphohistidine phosphatase SixA [Phycisphaerae bacterium]NIV01858.1 phosphohistidine phosphatase SixA [Phycisphaerae bacterium]
MKLYLVQHAKAASKDVDPERSLTQEGRRDIQKVAAFIKSLNLSVDNLWHSTKTRAIQTAEILSEVIKMNKEKIEREGLAPNDEVTAIKDELVAAQQDTMIVSHMPFVSKLASLLLAGREFADTVAFRQGGIVALSTSESSQWQIEWMITPELLI